MTAFPAATFFTYDDAQDEGTVRQGLDDWLAATRQLIGAAAIEDQFISGGSVTPVSGTLRVEGQGSVADDLTTIVTTNLPEGSLLLLSIKDEGHIITVKHGAGAAGSIDLSGALDFAMNKLEQGLLLQRRGTLWYELGRFGREKEHAMSSELGSGWTATTTPLYWKDPDGVVYAHGGVYHASVTGTSATVLTFPAGYRPAAALYGNPVQTLINSTTAGIDYVDISAGGVMTWRATATTGSLTSDRLDVAFNINFRAGA